MLEIAMVDPLKSQAKKDAKTLLYAVRGGTQRIRAETHKKGPKKL